LFYSTGSGKTLAAYLISKNFIDQFKQIREINILNKNAELYVPNVKILGFTKDNIKLEFLKFPELGFISEDEKKHIELIKDKFGADSQEYINERTKYITRLSNKNYGGYFNFYGYQEIVNKLFVFKKQNIDFKTLTVKRLHDEIVRENIIVNYEFLNEFKDTLIICDEIHNIYNSAQINNYGLAILYILLNNKNTKLVGLSATPLNNNPREIIDLINILSIDNIDNILDENVYNNIITIYKNDIKKTTNENEQLNITTKKMVSLEQLVKKYLTGKILFYENIDLRYYPNREFMGEKIPGITLLPFIRCYMSDYFFENYINIITYDKYINDSTLSIVNNIYEDIILPEKILDERQLLNKSDEYKTKYIWLEYSSATAVEIISCSKI
jgi:DNA polymerase III delta prime subunit